MSEPVDKKMSSLPREAVILMAQDKSRVNTTVQKSEEIWETGMGCCRGGGGRPSGLHATERKQWRDRGHPVHFQQGIYSASRKFETLSSFTHFAVFQTHLKNNELNKFWDESETTKCGNLKRVRTLYTAEPMFGPADTTQGSNTSTCLTSLRLPRTQTYTIW